MDRLKALGRGTQLMFIASVLLLIFSFFNWQEVNFDLGPLGLRKRRRQRVGRPRRDHHGILTIVLIARIVARMAAVDVPIPVSFAMTSVVLGVLIFIIALLKNLTDDYSTWASYVGVVLAFLVAVGAWLEVQDARRYGVTEDRGVELGQLGRRRGCRRSPGGACTRTARACTARACTGSARTAGRVLRTRRGDGSAASEAADEASGAADDAIRRGGRGLGCARATSRRASRAPRPCSQRRRHGARTAP